LPAAKKFQSAGSEIAFACNKLGAILGAQHRMRRPGPERKAGPMLRHSIAVFPGAPMRHIIGVNTG
jgi:hypothetical protein